VITGAALYVLAIFAETYLGSATLPPPVFLVLTVATFVACLRVGQHVDRT